MKYFVTIAGRTVEVEIDGERVRLAGRSRRAELRTVDGTPVRNLLLDDSSWILPIEPDGRGRWLVQRWGERFEVEVMDERTRHIRSLVSTGGGHAGPASLKAPMPGLVVRILVEPGQTVAAGQGIVVLEAMKMENELKAHGPGVIDQIQVNSGQAVEKGALLATFRPVQAPA
jgi:pyruvate carboxylase subunit B